MQKKMPVVVEVEWKDSWTNDTGRWSAKQLREEPDFILTSTGYLLHRDKRGINLAGEYREQDKTGRHVQHIPAEMILEVRKLK